MTFVQYCYHDFCWPLYNTFNALDLSDDCDVHDAYDVHIILIVLSVISELYIVSSMNVLTLKGLSHEIFGPFFGLYGCI